MMHGCDVGGGGWMDGTLMFNGTVRLPPCSSTSVMCVAWPQWAWDCCAVGCVLVAGARLRDASSGVEVFIRRWIVITVSGRFFVIPLLRRVKNVEIDERFRGGKTSVRDPLVPFRVWMERAWKEDVHLYCNTQCHARPGISGQLHARSTIHDDPMRR